MHEIPRSLRHVVVIGLMGAGKSSVGRRLAGHLGWAWHDSDRAIKAVTGLTVRQLRDREGVEVMHDREARQLLEALADPAPSVISAAASTIEVEACRRAMTSPDVALVWLRASPRNLARRFASADAHRPEFGSSPEAFLTEQATRRNPLFASLSPIVVDVDAISPGKAAAQALEALGSIGSP